MKPQYRPTTLEQALGHLVEECGEVLAAVGKTQRWGLMSVNPELPADQQETNRDWLLRELQDLRKAIDTAQLFIDSTPPCQQCGAMTPEEAETMCKPSRGIDDEYHCAGDLCFPDV